MQNLTAHLLLLPDITVLLLWTLLVRESSTWIFCFDCCCVVTIYYGGTLDFRFSTFLNRTKFNSRNKDICTCFLFQTFMLLIMLKRMNFFVVCVCLVLKNCFYHVNRVVFNISWWQIKMYTLMTMKITRLVLNAFYGFPEICLILNENVLELQ